MAASCDPKGSVLDVLKPPQIVLGGNRGPDRGSLGED